MTHKEDIERLRTMQRFLIDDLNKLEYHTNELIENIMQVANKNNLIKTLNKQKYFLIIGDNTQKT